MAISHVECCDNMDFMSVYPDKFFDLAIVDPEYGIDAGNMTMGSGKNKRFKKKNWDKNPPDESYFKELFRVSKNQIICGGNYFTLPLSRGWIFWDKGIYGDCSFADGELLWTSFDIVLRVASIRYKGFLGADAIRIHNTQKPIALYTWLLQNYATKGDKIIDTHLGSGSSRISANDLGFDFYGCELDFDYWLSQEKRFANHISQIKIFKPEQIQPKQIELL